MAPWDDDDAADWFYALMKATGLAQKVEEALLKEVNEYTAPTIRAAASVLVMMGRGYVWDIDVYDKHLQLAVVQLEELRKLYEPDFQIQIDNEIAVLQLRMDSPLENVIENVQLQKWWSTWL